MKYSLRKSLILLTLLTSTSLSFAEEMTSEQRSMLNQYCLECHNLEDFSGGLAFELITDNLVHEEAEIWETVIRKLRGGMMPPPGQPRPSETQLSSFLTSLESELDHYAFNNPYPGTPSLHRLNRREYQNAIRDLLDLPIDASTMLPADDSSSGFDNIANALAVSPTLMQAYVSSATKISRLALGDSTTSPNITEYQAGSGGSQSSHIRGLPLGTRGGLSVQHVFPLDAEYQINIRRSGANNFVLPMNGLEESVEVVLDGEQIRVIPAGESTNITLPVSAGPHQIEVAFLHTQAEQGIDDLFTVHGNSTSIGGIAINGPFNVTGSGSTPSRDKVFVCRPERPSEETDCAEQILSTLATRAFRRPVDDTSLSTLMKFYESGKKIRGFETGIQYALARILVDPQFIFRFEEEQGSLSENTIYALDDFELATRLSFFLWSSIPDDELLRLAQNNQLSQPAILEQQVERMLNDEKANALTQNFATQWLALEALETVNPVDLAFDRSLQASMREETERLFDSILKENRSILDLLSADYTFVDERLARHYGIPNIRGSHFRRVSVPEERQGILGHAAFLTLTSAPNRTSPVKRGQYVLEKLLGTPPPPPPAGVETNLEETAPAGSAPTTIRQRLEKHQSNPACSDCHGMIDPIGFALENYNSIGQWRDFAGESPVNATTELWDGTSISGPNDLRIALLERSDIFVLSVAEKMMTYALGRKVEYYDMPFLREIVQNSADENYTIASLAKGIIASPAFQMRVKAEAEEKLASQ